MVCVTHGVYSAIVLSSYEPQDVTDGSFSLPKQAVKRLGSYVSVWFFPIFKCTSNWLHFILGGCLHFAYRHVITVRLFLCLSVHLSVVTWAEMIVLPSINGHINYSSFHLSVATWTVWYHTHNTWSKKRLWNICVLCGVYLNNPVMFSKRTE
jgi:hypothetical protein